MLLFVFARKSNLSMHRLKSGIESTFTPRTKHVSPVFLSRRLLLEVTGDYDEVDGLSRAAAEKSFVGMLDSAHGGSQILCM